MEIREYWRVVVDRFPVIAVTFGIALIVALISVFLLPQGSTAYSAELGLAIRPQPLPVTGTPAYSQDYYDYVASEYANDDLIAILQSSDFLKAVQQRVGAGPGGPVDGSIDAKKAHRVVTITTTSSSGDGAVRLAQGIADLLTAPAAQSTYFGLFSNRREDVSLVEAPRIVSAPAGRSAALNVAARALIGLALGVALAFLVEYLDDTIRPEDARALLDVPVLAEIPGPGVPRPPKVRYRVATATHALKES